MAELVPTSLTRFRLTDQEEQQSQIFSQLQILGLQNLLADAAEERLSLKVDPQNISQFLQQEASIEGRITVLRYLIDTSKAQTENLLIASRNFQDN